MERAALAEPVAVDKVVCKLAAARPLVQLILAVAVAARTELPHRLVAPAS